MKITAQYSGVPGTAGSAAVSFGLPSTLSQGDSLEARVLSAEGGNAVLKAGDGRIFHAKLDGGAALRAGENVLLTVEDNSDGVIVLTVARAGGGGSTGFAESGVPGSPVGQAGVGAQIDAALMALGLPAGGAAARAAGELVGARAELTPAEAVFIAAHGVRPGAEEGLEAALRLMSGEGRIDIALGELMRLLARSAEQDEGLTDSAGGVPRDAGAEQADAMASESVFEAPASGEVRVEEFAAYSPENESTPEGFPRAVAPSEGFGTLDAPSAGEGGEIAAEPALLAKAANDAAVAGNGTLEPRATLRPGSPAQPRVGAEPSDTRDAGAESAEAGGVARPERNPADKPTSAGARESYGAAARVIRADESERITRAFTQSEDGGAPVRTELSARDELPGETPPDSVPTDRRAVNARYLADAVGRLFTDIGDENAAGKLKAARDGLPECLEQLAETAARGGLRGGETIARQAGKILEQVKFMNSAQQYAWAQMPIVIRGERRAAELYVFKRKKGDGAGSGGVSVLLTLDLPALGHWEAFIDIRGHDVSVQMRAADESVREHLLRAGARLHEVLAQSGYRLTGARVTCRQAEPQEETEGPAPLRAAAALRRRGDPLGVDFVI